MSEEIIDVEAQIRVALLHNIRRPLLSLQLGFQPFSLIHPLGITSVKADSLHIQFFSIVHDIICRNIRHEIGKRGNRQIDIIFICMNRDPVSAEIKADRNRLPLKRNVCDPDKAGRRILPSHRFGFQRQGKIEKAVPVTDSYASGFRVENQLFPNPVFQHSRAVLFFLPCQRLLIQIIGICSDPQIRNILRLLIETQIQFSVLLSVVNDPDCLLRIRRIVRGGLFRVCTDAGNDHAKSHQCSDSLFQLDSPFSDKNSCYHFTL